MTVTLTIKQVPETLAAQLKNRASANKRSLQKELLVIMEGAATQGAAFAGAPWHGVTEPSAPIYQANSAVLRLHGKRPDKSGSGRLTLEQLWQHARKLGAAMPAESTDIVRRDRDAGYR